MAGRKLRHRGQAGTTLVELVVSVVIIGLALTLLVGAFSTGVIQSTLVKRNTAVESAMESELERIAGYAWDRVGRAEVTGRTVTLKVKFGDFTIITRSKSFPAPVADLAAFIAAGQTLLGALHPLPRGIRLLGLGLHNLSEEQQVDPIQLGLAI